MSAPFLVSACHMHQPPPASIVCSLIRIALQFWPDWNLPLCLSVCLCVFVIRMAQALLRALDIKIYTSAIKQTLSSPSPRADTHVQDRIFDRPKDPFASQVLQNSHKAQHHAPLLLSTLSLILISTHTQTQRSTLLYSLLSSTCTYARHNPTQCSSFSDRLSSSLQIWFYYYYSPPPTTHTHKTNTKQFQNWSRILKTTLFSLSLSLYTHSPSPPSSSLHPTVLLPLSLLSHPKSFFFSPSTHSPTHPPTHRATSQHHCMYLPSFQVPQKREKHETGDQIPLGFSKACRLRRNSETANRRH